MFIEDASHYNHFEKVKPFFDMYKYGMLPKDKIFTIYNIKHVTEMYHLFQLFYNDKDWETFQTNVIWARMHMNPGMFMYALTTVIIHHPKMEGLGLPAIYEIWPHYFVKSTVMHDAYQYKMQGQYMENFMTTIYNNHTDTFNFHMNDDDQLRYFTEDVGVNSYYFYFSMDYPYWLGGEEFGLMKDRRGEQYLYMHQQLLARYYMERLSNGMGSIPDFSLHKPIETGYSSGLSYYNGLSFPVRKNYYDISMTEMYPMMNQVEDYERRIRNSIDYGFYVKDEKMTMPLNVDMLGILMNANADSPNYRFYRSMEMRVRKLMGGTFDYENHHDYKLLPSVLEHYETSMRDPMFYQYYKTFVQYYNRFRDLQHSYTHDQLFFKDIEIMNVHVDKLQTYFDDFEIDITNGVDMNMFGKDVHMPETEEYKNYKKLFKGTTWDFMIKNKQMRLNHKPFEYSMDVVAGKPTKGVVRVYMAPKYDENGRMFDINENRENFVELDQFVYDFPAGKTTIKKSCHDFAFITHDRSTYTHLYKELMLSMDGGEHKYPIDMTESHCGWPVRLLLPKGNADGFPMQMFFMISPFVAPKVEQFSTYNNKLTCGIGSGSRFIDDMPFGYPFDRIIDHSVDFMKMPNMHFEDVKIYEKVMH